MENNIKIFEFNSNNNVRMILVDNNPWFVAKDVCDILGLTDGRKSVELLDEDERNIVPVTDSLGRNQNTYIVNEFGLYNLVLKSRKPEAKQFKRWITHEVIPQIRQTGGYIPVNQEDDEDQILAKAFLIAQKTIDRQKQLIAEKEQKIAEMQPDVDFAQAIKVSDSLILVGDLAKLLKQKGVDIGSKRLFEAMRDNGYLGTTGNNYNIPTQKSMNLGLFELRENSIPTQYGTTKLTFTPMVTTKGQEYFMKKLLAKNT